EVSFTAKATSAITGASTTSIEAESPMSTSRLLNRVRSLKQRTSLRGRSSFSRVIQSAGGRYCGDEYFSTRSEKPACGDFDSTGSNTAVCAHIARSTFNKGNGKEVSFKHRTPRPGRRLGS